MRLITSSRTRFVFAIALSLAPRVQMYREHATLTLTRADEVASIIGTVMCLKRDYC